jgi:naphthalene 1,2-dioxygenase system ferredoxin subunit
MTDEDWIRAASAREVKEAGGMLGRLVGGVPVAVYEVDGTYFATSNRCTHGRARLSSGYLEGYLIECPVHQGLFDIRTGEAKGPPCTEPLPTFPVRQEGEYLLVGAASIRKFQSEKNDS